MSALPTSTDSIEMALAEADARLPEGRTRYNKYTHEALADLRILNPRMAQQDLAKHFGYTPGHISTLMATDAFQAILERRRQELEMPLLKEEIEARFKAVTQRSLEVLQEKLAAPASVVSDALLLKAVELGAKGMGVGGFAPPAPPPPTTPQDGRLAHLAQRLEALIPDRRAGAIDVEVKEVSK